MQAARCFNEDSTLGVDVVFLTAGLRKRFVEHEMLVHGTRLLNLQPYSIGYFRRLHSEGIDLLLTIDYRPNYQFLLWAMPNTPIIIWVQDPRSPEDATKLCSLQIPGKEGVRPDGIERFNTASLQLVVRASQWLRRPVVFAAHDPSFASKIEGTYGIRAPELVFLPDPIDIDPGHVTKSNSPVVVFLGRLDPYKRPWLVLELARQFPQVIFQLMGQASFKGKGGWEPDLLPGNVQMLGHVEGTEKTRVLSSAWVLVNTSIHEGLPISMLEALACETPLLSLQDPCGLVSQFGIYAGRWDGTGLEGIPALATGLRRLLLDRHLRTKLGRAGREWVSETHNRSRFLAAFNDLCTQAGILR